MIKAILSYLLGSISGSLVLGRFKGVDIRKSGSGNAGGTNAFRTQGTLFALGVVLIDVTKGYVATTYLSLLNLSWLGIAANTPYDQLMVVCGSAAIIGHVYPVFYNFKGGKGAGTAVGMIIALEPIMIPVAVGLWLVVLTTTGFVGLATIITGLSIPVQCFIFEIGNDYFLITAVIMSLFIVFTHRSNITRLRAGTENQFKKIMIFRKN